MNVKEALKCGWFFGWRIFLFLAIVVWPACFTFEEFGLFLLPPIGGLLGFLIGFIPEL